ncbi:MAG: hypothetical protein OSB25_09590 [Salibacteraceae bacterium]|nr:hypothetical protein [Salibacteraceae bacterium]|tara:strand:+ start:53261 stop:53980 length:720 start_codon:yes stop_codon:yes gene_type:complete
MKKTFSILKIIGKILLGLTVTVTAVLICLFFVYNEKLPEGKQSVEADELASKMLKAVHHEAYKQTRYLEWTFVGQHHYKWDKKQQLVAVEWDDFTVHLNIQNPDSSTVLVNDVEVNDDSRSEIIETAIGYFNNDSFWLSAPQKIFDPGTERRIVLLENGDKALLVSYTSGGNTPGDSYLWLLDESGLPSAFKIWVSIIPLGGVKATWESWITAESGALLPSNHKLLFLDISMGEVKAWN